MAAPVLPYVAWVAAGCIATLVAYAREDRKLLWVAKPLASLGFVAAAAAWGATGSAYGGLMLLAFALSLAGDVLLVPAGASRAFLGGLGCFAAAHVAFAAAFLLRGPAPLPGLAAALVLTALLALALPRLAPLVPGRMRPFVVGYAVVIELMVSAALATAASRPAAAGAIALGAVLFAVSDGAVFRHRFVAAGLSNKLWGLPMYYAAQLLLAASLLTR